jgi:hypothetical protein
MATMTWNNERTELEGRLFIFPRVFQYFRSIFGGEKTTPQDMAAFETAMNTLKLAAEPGENYAAIAARMKLEAETYRDFLLNPKPIGKISLIVKEIDPDSRDFRSPREQYKVHDPAKGWASVGYEFDRSDTKVLEFMMYDTEGSPLFAITRTYSNWIGCREFNLGLDRVFCLNMVEVSPGCVMAHASFRMAAERESARDRQRILEPAPQVPAPVGKVESGRSIFEFLPFGRRLAYALVLQCMVISLICSTVIWVATGRAMSRQGSLARQTTDHSLSDTTTDPSVANLPDGKTALYATSGGTETGSNDIPGEAETVRKIRMAQKAKRLAKVEGFSISVDNNSCKSGESRCLELLSTIQKRVESNLSSVSLRAYTPDQPNERTEPAKLIVSYNPIDTLHGHVHLTLYDHQGELWDDKGNLTYAAPSVVENYCEEASSKILLEIITAKIRVNSNPQEGEKTSESE